MIAAGFRLLAIAAGLGLVSGLAAAPAIAQDADFYKGKSIELIISTGSGLGFDTNARLVARHLGRHVPGNPSFVAKNMPGGGHVRAANYMFAQAPKDGTSIGAIVPAFVTAQVVNRTDAIQFDAARLNWLGSTNSSNSTVFVMTATGVKSIEDVKRREILMGGTGAGSYSTLFPVLLNNVLGTRFKVVSGYQSTREVTLAIERGEVQGRAGNNLNSLRQENPDWVRDGKIVILTQVGYERDPEFKSVPLMTELAQNEEQRRIFEVFSADIVIGRPLLLPPGVPAERVALLRRAFDAAMKDPELLKDAQKIGIDINPLPGDRIQRIVEDFVKTPADIVAKARKASEGS